MTGSPAPLPADLDLRLVRCFTVLAEQRHFGRAAAKLRLAPSSLSRQIARLERDVGARLLDRTPQGSRLTEAGEVFLPLARALLRSAGEAAARTRSAARPLRVTVGYISGLIVTSAVRALRRRRPEAEVRTAHLDWRETRAALLEHRVDVAVARLPFRTDGLHVTVLYDEPRALLVPRDHRLAGKESVTLEEIAGEPMPQGSDPEWNAFWRVDPRPDGSRVPEGPVVEAVADKIELVAGGQAVAIVPLGAAAGADLDTMRPDLALVPLDGVAPCQVVLATRAGERSRLVAEFAAHARTHLPAPGGK